MLTLSSLAIRDPFFPNLFDADRGEHIRMCEIDVGFARPRLLAETHARNRYLFARVRIGGIV